MTSKRSRWIIWPYHGIVILMLGFLSPPEIKAQSLREIKGTVLDSLTRATLPGVSVVLKGTNSGISTGTNGEFSINAKKGDILVASFVSYERQEVIVGDQNVINIILRESSSALEKVVVVGYGTQKKVNLTGSIATVDAEFLESRPLTNSSQALQGVGGVYVNQTGGQPGADNAAIRIRGIGTLNNNNPLVLVDGIEYNLRDVNPNDVESISVLKDAASASIYGNRAANGVILITTKTGKKENLKIELNSYFGLQQATYLPDVVTNSVDWMNSRNQAALNDGQPIVFSNAQIEEYKNGKDPDIYPNTNWYDIMFSTAPMQDHHLRLSGGTDMATFSVSLGYLNQDGILMGTGAKKYSLNSNVIFKKSDRLRFGIIINGSFWDRKEPVGGASAIMNSVTRALPIHPNKLADGRYGDTWLVTPGHNLFRHPVAIAMEGGQNNITQQAMINLFTEYILPLGIKYKGTLAINKFDSYDRGFTPEIFIYNPKQPGVPRTLRYDPPQRSAQRSNNNNLNTSFFQTLNWTKKIAERNNVNLLFGFSMESFSNSNFNAYVEGFLGNELTELNAGTINKNVGGTSSQSRLMSYFGRANYSFSDKYLFEFNFRYDGSSRFAKGNQWGLFPSLSAGWRIDQEAFMQNIPSVSNLKLRASWGRLGNQNIPLYSFLNNININQNTPFNNTIVAGSAITTLSDPNISWETTTISNIGLDLGLWNNSVEINVDVFDKVTRDILSRITIPGQVGNLAGPITNLYGMSNKGFEIGTSYRNSIGNLKYRTGANFAYVDNNVDFLNGAVQYTTNDFGNISVIKEGYPVNSWYLFEAIGIFQTLEEVKKHAYQNPTTAPGDIKYRDVNEDGKIDPNDMRILGRSVPKHTYSFNVDLNYKGFDASTLLQGVQGIDIYPWFNLAFGNYNGAGITKEHEANSWTPANPNARYPRLFEPKRGTGINAQNSTFWLKDASYLRLKNVQLGYSFSSALINKINVNKIRVYVNAQNFLTFSKYTLTDPEKNIDLQSILEYPTTKIVTVGCNIIF